MNFLGPDLDGDSHKAWIRIRIRNTANINVLLLANIGQKADGKQRTGNVMINFTCEHCVMTLPRRSKQKLVYRSAFYMKVRGEKIIWVSLFFL